MVDAHVVVNSPTPPQGGTKALIRAFKRFIYSGNYALSCNLEK
ncbi:hypothetical protein CRC_03090 [Cylindrospermopsis raciborskii CS-505]|nr:hypothetical protein CRC_03090 [Cylindrospermopsis raciborskii CS-505]